MFASVWQILTGIFLVSVLVKLVFKLIKEESSSRTFLLGLGGSGNGNSELFATSRQAGVLAAGGELGLEATPGSSGGPSQEELSVEEQVLRNYIALNLEDDDLFLRSNQEEQQDGNESSSSSSSSASLHSAISPFAINNEQAACQELYHLQRDFHESQDEEEFLEQVDSSRIADTFSQEGHEQEPKRVEGAQNEEEGYGKAHQTKQVESLKLCYQIASETFLLEPLKVFLNLLGSSIELFWSLLDSIEGIESEEEREDSPASFRQAQQVPTSSSSSSAGSSAATSCSRPEVGQLEREKRGSNYFHRRYFSRRPLSAVLLEEDWNLLAEFQGRDCSRRESFEPEGVEEKRTSYNQLRQRAQAQRISY